MPRRDEFVAAYDSKHNIVMEGDNKAMMIIGKEDFPFPIPLVRRNGIWQFDAVAGHNGRMCAESDRTN